jgi:uncharacterized caspase-like protein
MRLAKTVSFVSLCLLLLGIVAQPHGVAAQDSAQEKRIALVIGNGAYAKGPLATAANDAGLIAQTLQAAGFDVIGARDLDGDSLRKSFRDFMQKALSSDGNTVAMVYLAGYGVQLAGENYFIPVDSTISRDTDIPTEGLRLSDYIRQLAAIPLKTSVVVLDAARQQPFIEGGPPMAGGLALVEPDTNMLIAFNAAPGTVAPNENGSYGIYAQSLAEMIRTGGLSLPEVFDRVRLRVSEATKGAQVPWDGQKMQAAFTFFDRAPDAPVAQAAPAQAAAMHDRPIRELGTQEAFTVALERDTLPAYEEFLTAYGSDPLAKRVRAVVAIRREAITWRRTFQNDTPDGYWSYLQRYPYGPHAEDARRRLAILTAPLEPPPSFAMIDYDVPPPPPDEIVYVDRPVLVFSDPEFAFAPPPTPPLYVLPPPPPDFVVLSPPIAPIGLFILPQPVFVAMPGFVRPPAYVAPPPNNIIFANIHNTTVINTVINQPPQPAGPAGPGAASHPMAGAALPPAVAQRASLINEGKLPPPPSAALNPVARPGAPGPVPANVMPSAVPQAQMLPDHGQANQGLANRELPKANALPIPGEHGAPPAVTGSVNPRATLSPSGAAPAGIPAEHRRGSAGKPVVPAPQPGLAPSFHASRTPPGAAVAPVTRPVVQPRIERTAPPAARMSPPAALPRQAAPRQMAPRPVATRPVAPMVRAAPPQLQRPAAPPPRPAAPATAMARPMAPPAMARPAPPPRPAAPAAKKCPPNVGHC